IHADVFSLAFRKLTNDLARTFLRSKDSINLSDLREFVKREGAFIKFQMSSDKQLPAPTLVNKRKCADAARKQLNPKPDKQVFMLHSVVGEDVSGSEDEDDEVFIDAKVPLLWDPGARKTLHPVSLFEHNDLKKRFR